MNTKSMYIIFSLLVIAFIPIVYAQEIESQFYGTVTGLEKPGTIIAMIDGKIKGFVQSDGNVYGSDDALHVIATQEDVDKYVTFHACGKQAEEYTKLVPNTKSKIDLTFPEGTCQENKLEQNETSPTQNGETQEGETTTTTVETQVTEVITPPMQKPWYQRPLIWTIIAVILIILAIIIWPKGTKEEKEMKQASELHQKAEQAYLAGDDEEADEYYKQAEEARKHSSEEEDKE